MPPAEGKGGSVGSQEEQGHRKMKVNVYMGPVEIKAGPQAC